MKDFRNNAENLPSGEKMHFKVVKSGGGEYIQEEEVLSERDMEISVNGTPVARLRCTPTALTELVLGRLYTEQIIRSIDDVAHLFICGEGNIAEVRLKEKIAFQPYTGAEPTCCTGNLQLQQTKGTDGEIRGLPRFEEVANPEPEMVFELADHFLKDGELHRNTSGTHSCYIRFGDGRILGFEDIGRHNALDKAVGAMLQEGCAPEECMLFTTGRVPMDMVQKAVAARIPVLISKSVPTAEAIRMAERYRLLLIVRAWPDSYEIPCGG